MEQDLTDPGFWFERPTLITGASGFLGGWLVEGLVSRKADVVCLMRNWSPKCQLVQPSLIQRVHIVHGDVRDQALLEGVLGEFEVNTVFHLAAQAVVRTANSNPISTFETNVRGTWSLLEACRHSSTVRGIVVASSDKVYGDQDRVPYCETTPLRAVHPYPVSKACLDMIAQMYAITYDLPVVVTRCGNLYGGGDLNWSRIIPATIRCAVRGRPPIVYSDGNDVRDYLYVEDGVAAYIKLAENLIGSPQLRGEVFNFSTGVPVTVLELITLILGLMDSNLRPEIRNEVTQEIRCQYLATAKALRMLNWKPSFTLEEGLKRTIPWYQEFLRHGRTTESITPG